MRIIGIDPGVNGAVGVISSDGKFVDAFEMPTVLANKTGNKQMVNVPELARLLRSHVREAGGEIFAIIEKVQPMPSQQGAPGEERRSMGASSAFSFGKSVGAISATVHTLGISLEEVMPGVWKKAMQLGNVKDQSRTVAQRLWPDAPLGLKKHHNRAEALLLAKYYRERFMHRPDGKPF